MKLSEQLRESEVLGMMPDIKPPLIMNKLQLIYAVEKLEADNELLNDYLDMWASNSDTMNLSDARTEMEKQVKEFKELFKNVASCETAMWLENYKESK